MLDTIEVSSREAEVRVGGEDGGDGVKAVTLLPRSNYDSAENIGSFKTQKHVIAVITGSESALIDSMSRIEVSLSYSATWASIFLISCSAFSSRSQTYLLKPPPCWINLLMELKGTLFPFLILKRSTRFKSASISYNSSKLA